MPDNTPAFPRPGGVIAHPHDQFEPVAFGEQDGMGLRDYFAGQALIGIINQSTIAEVAHTIMAVAAAK